MARHPTTLCSIAADKYMRWVATLPQIPGGTLLKPGDEIPEGFTVTVEHTEATKAARRAYEAHVSRCKICRGEA